MSYSTLIVVVGLNSRFLQHAQKRSRSNHAAYSQALIQNKIGRQGVKIQRIRQSRSRESGRQTVRRLKWMVFGVKAGEVGKKRMNQDRILLKGIALHKSC